MENDYKKVFIETIKTFYQENKLGKTTNLKKLGFLDSIDEKKSYYHNTLKESLQEFTDENVKNIRSQYEQNEAINLNIINSDKDHEQFLINLSHSRDLFTKKTSQNFHKTSKEFDLQIEKLISEQNQPFKQIKTNFNRSKSIIDKEIAKTKDVYENEISLIFNLKNQSIDQINNNYTTKQTLLSDQYRDFLDNRKIIINQIIKDKQKQVSANDTNYVLIKKTHNLQNEYLNKIVNTSKKNFNTLKIKLETKLANDIAKINTTYEKIKVTHQKNVIEEHNRYEQKLNALNIIFDVQKSSFNQNKRKLSKENSDSITLLNSKLSNNKDYNDNEKNRLKKQLFSDLKKVAEVEKQTFELEYNKALKQLDINLEKQIKRTNKDILKYKKNYQRQLYELETEHVKHINKWRVSRNIYEQEHKQLINDLEQKLEIINKNYELDLEHAKLNHAHLIRLIDMQISLDLLPIETQSTLASAVSEREINLLSNETQIYLQEKSLEEYIIKANIESERLNNEYLLNSLASEYQYNEHKTTIQAQLDQELSKLKRDNSLDIFEQKLILEQLNVSRGEALKDYQTSLYNMTNLYLRESHKIIASKQIESLRYNLNNFSLMKKNTLLKYKSTEQTKQNLLKVESYLSSNLLSYHKNKRNLESFYDNILNFYYIINTLTNLTEEYFNLPTTPVSLRTIMLSFNVFIQNYLKDITNLVDDYEKLILDDLDEVIENFSGYKYMIKHEDILSDFSNKESVILDEISTNERKAVKWQQQLKNTENNIIKLNQMINHENVNKQNGSKLRIKNYNQGITNSKKQGKKIESKLRKLLIDNVSLNDNLTKLTKLKEQKESFLNKNKELELTDLYNFKKEINILINNLKKLFNNISTTQSNFFNELANPNDFYLTLDKFNSFLLKHKRILDKKHTLLLDLYTDLHTFHYEKYEYFNDIQTKIKTSIINASNSITIKLDNNYESDLETSMISYEQKRLDFDKQSSDLHANYHKNKSLILNTFNNAIKELDLKLLHAEKEIQLNQENLFKQQTILKANLTGVINDLNNELKLKIKTSKAENEHQIKKNLKYIKNSQDTFNVTKESNMRKHKALLERYRINHDKALGLKVNKTIDLESQLKKVKTTHSRLITSNLNNLETIKLKNKLFVANHDKNLKKFEKNANYEQRFILRKDLKTLKKSYLFKINELKLK